MIVAMKRIGLLFYLGLLLSYLVHFVFFSHFDRVFAACPENVVPNFLDPNCKLGDKLTLGFFIGRLFSVLPVFLFIGFTGILAYGGFLLLFSKGDPNQVEKGKSVIKDAIIGVLVLSSIGALLFLVSFIVGVDLLSWIGL